MIDLEELGKRICIIGCSSSGKSTLANKLSAKLNIPTFHLDILAHFPHSKWLRKPDNDLISAHNNILKENEWIIDGNYSLCMPERIAKASSILWLDTNNLTSAFRYLIRSLKNNPDRIGRLPGAQNELRLFMLKQILFIYPKNRLKYQKLIRNYNKRVISIKDMKELNQYYKHWGL